MNPKWGGGEICLLANNILTLVLRPLYKKSTRAESSMTSEIKSKVIVFNFVSFFDVFEIVPVLIGNHVAKQATLHRTMLFSYS